MTKFQVVKKGYDKNEVDQYVLNVETQLETSKQKIAKLEQELLYYRQNANEINEKEQNITLALTAAVEKAKQIEKSSLNVYSLKVEELQILYARWERVLNELVNKYPNLDEIDNVKRLMKDFKNSITDNLKEHFRFAPMQNEISSNSDPMQVLLSKMNYYSSKKSTDVKKMKTVKRERKSLSKDMKTKQTELNKLEEKSMIKPIFSSKIEDGEKFETLADKFLTESATPDSAYANKLTGKIGAMPEPNESGFNLKEAVNPKDDLEEIMKSFDFFKPENKNN